MTPPNLAEVLGRNRREHRGSLLVYLMVDAARRRRLPSLVRGCWEAGVTGIELGFPFSDPIADGPVLQAAASRALGNGTQWSDLLGAIGATADELPVAVMTYANPVLHRGLRHACRAIAAAGGSGLIVPDLALEESAPWVRASRRAGLSLVQMGSPATPASRVRTLARSSSGFLYLVSRFGTTGRGVRAPGSPLRVLIGAAHGVCPELPVLVGFGIRTSADVTPIRRMGADGVVVGTAVEEILSGSTEPARLLRYLRRLSRAIGARGPGD
ncbi:MAG: tryptophan synthase subunit alpha [Thermoplasmata archaeon]|nr:tryptophan synthase subunit alpha [Thermoplasmata archaeon]